MDYQTRIAVLKARIETRCNIHGLYEQTPSDKQSNSNLGLFFVVSVIILCYWTVLPLCVGVIVGIFTQSGYGDKRDKHQLAVSMYKCMHKDLMKTTQEFATLPDYLIEEHRNTELNALEIRLKVLEEMFPLK